MGGVSSDKRTDLLDLLDAFVHRDSAPPGFVGTIAIGISTGGRIRWWEGRFNRSAQTTITETLADDVDAALFLTRDVADSILRTPSEDSGTAVRYGDGAILERFLERYLSSKDLLSLRRIIKPRRLIGMAKSIDIDARHLAYLVAKDVASGKITNTKQLKNAPRAKLNALGNLGIAGIDHSGGSEYRDAMVTGALAILPRAWLKKPHLAIRYIERSSAELGFDKRKLEETIAREIKHSWTQATPITDLKDFRQHVQCIALEDVADTSKEPPQWAETDAKVKLVLPRENLRNLPLSRLPSTVDEITDYRGSDLRREIQTLAAAGIDCKAAFLAAFNAMSVLRRIRAEVIATLDGGGPPNHVAELSAITADIAKRVGQLFLMKDPEKAEKVGRELTKDLNQILQRVRHHGEHTKYGNLQALYSWTPFLRAHFNGPSSNSPNLGAHFPLKSPGTDGESKHRVHSFLDGIQIPELKKLRARGGTVVFASSVSSGVIEAGIIAAYLKERYGLEVVLDPVFLESGDGRFAIGPKVPKGPYLVIPHDDQIVGSGYATAMAAKATLSKYPVERVDRSSPKLWEHYAKLKDFRKA